MKKAALVALTAALAVQGDTIKNDAALVEDQEVEDFDLQIPEMDDMTDIVDDLVEEHGQEALDAHNQADTERGPCTIF